MRRHITDFIRSAILIGFTASVVAVSSLADGIAPFPWDLSNVRFEMTLSELSAVRAVKPCGPFSNETAAEARIWCEIGIEQPFYDAVQYYFSEHGGLEVVSKLLECGGTEAQQNSAAFLGDCIKHWGRDFRLVAAELRHSRRSYVAPVVVWDMDQYYIAATFTPSEHCLQDARAVFQVRAAKKSTALDKLFRVQAKVPDSLRREVDELTEAIN